MTDLDEEKGDPYVHPYADGFSSERFGFFGVSLPSRSYVGRSALPAPPFSDMLEPIAAHALANW